MQRNRMQQATPSLRRKKGSGSGVCAAENREILMPIFVILGILLLAGFGLLHEFGKESSAAVLDVVKSKERQSVRRGQEEQQQPLEQSQAESGLDKQQEIQDEKPSSVKKELKSSTDHLALPHLKDIVPVLPAFPEIPNAEQLMDDLLNRNKPTMAGIVALMQKFVSALHDINKEFGKKYEHGAGHGMEIIESFFTLAKQHLGAFDDAYRNKSIFPVRQDGSIYLSLAAYREHLLAETMVLAFEAAKNPEKLFVGAVVQNCFGPSDVTGLSCKTGVQVVGKTAKGKPETKISDAPPDKNGIEDFCNRPNFRKFCDNGQVRVMYVHETESLGPAMARYYASKLWGGETYFMQCDSHLMFAQDWDEKYRQEIRATSNYPKSVLSSYPPGFSEDNRHAVRESNGARLCTCTTLAADPNPIVRINSGVGYNGKEPRPTQIPFIAAGFFLARAEFLTEWPFDPYMPWLFMGEEIALSMRAWTNGWNIYAPRKNIIAHQYRPGRLGLPKFWETASRVYKGPGMNNILQSKVIKRTKHMVGYPDSSLEKIRELGIEVVLTDIEHYGLGSTRSWQDYLDFASMSIDKEQDIVVCHPNQWCNRGEKD